MTIRTPAATLVRCWSLVAADTALDGSRIAVESVPAKLVCRVCRVCRACRACPACGDTTELGGVPEFVRGHYADTDLEIVAGEEFLITSLELAEAG
ncbi:hydrogenase/urease maturation nickel metallochaperone HypA [Protofrankia coriariae]|uniref:hydrogenase/urease maturation nickel metallochaperone HypA n=1 Tax=Protofrankia coriariae TaxID=1562887 RepID=UPI00069AB024|nr:hydrogenase/urease maturation nickel metallochaperone HypA [Protofrankia coriariae]